MEYPHESVVDGSCLVVLLGMVNDCFRCGECSCFLPCREFSCVVFVIVFMWYLHVGAMLLVDCWSFIVDGSAGTIVVVKACDNIFI